MDHGAIVVGGGHNGLICATYLARAGIDTLVVEARSSVGGCASTVDALGARVNICNCDHTLVRTTPVLDELDLASHGLRYLDVDPAQQSLRYDGGPAWPVFHDVERTIDGLRRTYPDQVDGYRRYVDAALPVARLLQELANQPPTAGGVLRTVAERRGRGVATLLRWSRMSVADVFGSFFTDDAVSGPGIVVGPVVWGLAPSTPGTGLGALTYAMKHAAQVGRPAGGSGALPAALLGALEAAGGTVRCDARVAAILCEGERVRGVELDDGTRIEAPLVVSACDPRETFVAWLRNAPSAAEPLVARWRATEHRDGYESKLDAVVAERAGVPAGRRRARRPARLRPPRAHHDRVALADRDRPSPPGHGRRSRRRSPDAVRQRPVGARPVDARARARGRARAQPRGALHPLRPARVDGPARTSRDGGSTCSPGWSSPASSTVSGGGAP